MIDTLRLTAEEATGLLERGEVTGAELLAAYRDAIAARDPELHAFLRTVDEPEGDGVWKLDNNEMTSAIKFLGADGTLAASKLAPDDVARIFNTHLLPRHQGVAGA